MEKEKFLTYDFVNNTITNFCKIHGCSHKYVYNKIREYNLPHKITVKKSLNRDIFGKFTFKKNTIKHDNHYNDHYNLFKKHIPLDEKLKQLT